jgi:hypothetical protein
MTFEREEFTGTKPRQPPRDERHQLAMIRQAGISAHLMTGDPHWDQFLTYLQAAVEANCAQRDSFLNDLLNPLLVNADEVAKRRIAIIRLAERIDVLQFVLSMPAHLKRAGDLAAMKLRDISEDS